MSSLAQRVLVAWLFSLVFLTLLVLKLDGRVQWSWFMVFGPVWVFDGSLCVCVCLRMVGRCKTGVEWVELRQHAWHLVALLLRLAFCLVLCTRLHGLLGNHILAIYVCIPLWTLLAGTLVQLGCTIFPHTRID